MNNSKVTINQKISKYKGVKYSLNTQLFTANIFTQHPSVHITQADLSSDNGSFITFLIVGRYHAISTNEIQSSHKNALPEKPQTSSDTPAHQRTYLSKVSNQPTPYLSDNKNTIIGITANANGTHIESLAQLVK